ncbi:tRNA (uridine(34)/cytosine(34)/5-carboxymethylaminomethyluridine(34)-2'-O)-methyltransferase TrmL [Crassaminicella thermophila]|uniref:Putative tRNA (cytidine(34)-2'-O)-methyltransferase n=1 Tax=Crassaminicella thermophila TaxID=2599308 RepID=A0A5C0SD40_CRATE|nr:tRNA (uridine(34)/cytosine(34)/5-carboxymethylaminomethyluridine(34)-2'-O)-methyltransferase TrmL [Crassaminicella thermophila]QEK11842.1 tRNA (uridine(34)/cytosine(34)/5-carboxymethylaminomethyluridine(34)-2'-O)-methyltransferase TrmL [Crassaminicella thermophila]
MAINIVLFEPEIPPNTGNIARTCAATGSRLHLIKPLGFSIDDKHLKRAGLDYWDLLDLHVYENIYELFNIYKDAKFFFATTKAKKFYTDMKYEDECFIVFGKETAGLPKEILMNNMDTSIKIPMVENERARSLNLANSVNIILYEALRQTGFVNLV